MILSTDFRDPKYWVTAIGESALQMRTDSTRSNSKRVRKYFFLPNVSIIKNETSSPTSESCYEQEERGRTKRVSPTEVPYCFQSQSHCIILNLSFSLWYVSVDVFSRSTETELFVQNTTILTYKQQCIIRRELEACVTLGIHSLQGKNDKPSVICNHFQAAVCRLPTAMLLYMPAHLCSFFRNGKRGNVSK